MAAVAGGAKARSWWWRIHHLAGLQVSLLLCVVFFTGTLATISPEIDWLLNPAMRVAPSDAPRASWGRLMAGAQAGAAGARIERIELPVESRFAAEAIAVAAHGERFRVQIDPWSGAPLGTTAWAGARRILRDLHRHLMLPGWIGLPLVALLSLPLLASLVTAFAIYKKWWRGYLRVPKGPKRPSDRRRFVGDLHRWVGLWALPFIAVTGLTGFWYLIEWAGAKQSDPTLSRPLAPSQASGTALDAMVAKAQSAMPRLRIAAVEFPWDGEGLRAGGVRFEGNEDAVLVRIRANAVLIDAGTGAAVAQGKGTGLRPGQRIAEAADPLHFGTWGGTATRWFWFVFGLALTGIAVTGVLIHAMRISRTAGHPMRLVGATRTGMGAFSLPVLATLLFSLSYLGLALVGR